MARVTNILGSTISGRYGDMVFYNRKGKSFVRSVGRRRSSPSSKEIERREKFAMSSKMAKCIYGIPELKSLWNKFAGTNGTGFQAIQRINYQRVNVGDILRAPAIVPDSVLFSEPVERVRIEEGILRFKLNTDEIFGIDRNDLIDKTVIAGMIFTRYKLNVLLDDFRFHGVKGIVEKRGKCYCAVINIIPPVINALNEYEEARIYFSLVCGDTGIGNFSRILSF